MATKKKASKEISIEEKLFALYDLQFVNSNIDEIKILRGDLPLEVQDMEDEIVGLETRLQNIDTEISELKTNVKGKKVEIEEANMKIERYKEQLNNVANNREYDNLTKEVEFQELEIQLCEKRIKEFTALQEEKEEEKKQATERLNDRRLDCQQKKEELSEIISETKQDEEKLIEKALKIEKKIEPRLLTAFKRIRRAVRNGLAVVPVERAACGGCFSKIPAQIQLDIRSRRKIIVCENCGRILVDQEMANSKKKKK